MQLTSGSEAVILNYDYQPTSGNVGNITGESGICVTEGAGIEIVSLVQSVDKLFPLPGLVAAILNFGIQTASGYVDSVISKSDFVEHVGVIAVEIVSFTKAVQMSFPLPF
jgi:hypothetical protein